ncbi:3-methyl-2-oxobutanoate hydroxymethyltransferase [Thermogutta terrifontis]|uniref:3-methyl-2-oxobutanoate hydroxymethyltransferase n=1 Tax=Thermogutta terrifontis TaxID=1331910 RepID=A0A286RE05_9BACT|nr:3-methyl-2-oxobutanoate hydroxymethyltransferase [Thermogutta terrifontis]ASV74177.1 3-methyl-2-oxobutanoate hydroxymethyltransferase [Thermogutta terrifontis]
MNVDTGPLTVPKFSALKRAGRKIAMVTAYDFPSAALADLAGVDGILVGDSVGMVVQGKSTTLPVTLDQMIYHAEMVCRAVRRALVVVDMPFMSYQTGVRDALINAGRILKETGAQAVKLEGGREQAELIAALVQAGIPVLAHLGLRPQAVRAVGGYRVERDRERLLADAEAVERAGAFAVILECIPVDIAAEITASVEIPTIGIGAGPRCDGQILVFHDLLGYAAGGRKPKHAKQYANLGEIINQALRQYIQEVQEGKFPGPEHSFS